jgi:hypothetical protein
MKQGIKRELWTLAQVITILMPWHLLSVSIKGQAVYLIIQSDRHHWLCLQRLTQLLHLFR